MLLQNIKGDVYSGVLEQARLQVLIVIFSEIFQATEVTDFSLSVLWKCCIIMCYLSISSILHSAMSCWWLEIGYGKSIYTVKNQQTQ